MTALVSPDLMFAQAAKAAALQRARTGTLDYCTTLTTDLPQTKVRPLSALDTMYAYFGSDEAGD